MRATGILRTWNDERGFGFIAPSHGGPELFVHLSAFPRDGSRPVVGETVSFELGRGHDNRPQAVNVVRSMVGSKAPPRRATTRRTISSRLATVIFVALLVGAGSWGYTSYKQRAQRQLLQDQPAEPRLPQSSTTPGQVFRCDGRAHCSQMTSCAEATWFINNCPGTQMDGNGDGVPCKQQWCTRPGAP